MAGLVNVAFELASLYSKKYVCLSLDTLKRCYMIQQKGDSSCLLGQSFSRCCLKLPDHAHMGIHSGR